MTEVIAVRVTGRQFRAALTRARNLRQHVAEATSTPSEFPDGAYTYFLTPDGLSGFAVADDGTAAGLFALVGGRGKDLVGQALGLGADKLDCFDGFLVGYYRDLGFAETRREPNYVEGGPDVVWMTYVG